MNDKILIKGLCQNNLKNLSLEIPKKKIVVFTGVSGSGKSSIVFDTIGSESQRQMNETYTAWIRGRLPKFEKPKLDSIENLSPSVIVDQSRLGGNMRSTVGTISDMYAMLRLLFSRIGTPYVGTASYFSFNDPNGMCHKCSGLGKVMTLDLTPVIDPEKSFNEGMIDLPAFHVGNWYWKQYAETKLFNLDLKYKDYSEKDKNLLLYGSYEKGGKRVHKAIEGLYNMMNRLVLNRNIDDKTERSIIALQRLVHEEICPECHGKRLNKQTLNCKVNGYSIDEMCEMEFTKLREVLREIKDSRASSIVYSLSLALTRMIDIGLPYLSMNRESQTLSGGEAQRLKLVRYMGSSLTDMIYIFDEPSAGMHPRDVYRMTNLLKSLRDKGNTVLVVEHDKDVISIADVVIDVGPLQGIHGGKIVFQGSYNDLLKTDTITGKALKEIVPINTNPRIPYEYMSIKNANIHNLKNVSIDIPLNILTVVTGVAGSGKSSLIRDFFANEHKDKVILIDQSPVTATNRSTPASYLGFFDEIRKIMEINTNANASMFSFNSKGACPVCKGKGEIVTELVFMDPVITTCESCEGKRFSKETLSYKYKDKTIVDILNMSAEEAVVFFEDYPKIKKVLNSMVSVGLSYLTLGQPLSTLSGGERQRIKLAKCLDQKGSIYVLDEPTTGLHLSDVKGIMKLLNGFVERGNTVIIIEHNTDVMKMADYIIDIGPDGGTMGGEVVFKGTVKEMIETSNTITATYLRKTIEE